MTFTKDKVLWCIIAAVVGAVLNDAYTAIKAALFAANWSRMASDLKGPVIQIALLNLTLPILAVYLFLRKYKFSAIRIEPVFRVLFVTMASVYLTVFAIHMIVGDVQPLVEDIKNDPNSKVVLFVFAVAYLVQALRALFRTGDGLKLKE